MSIYDEIYRAQRNQGYLGGTKGMYDKKKKKPNVQYEKIKVTFTAESAVVYKSTDSNGLSDPFVKVKKLGLLGSTVYESPVQSKTLNPIWNHTASFKLSKRKDKNYVDVMVELLDKDLIGKDKIGEYRLSLSGSGGANTVDIMAQEDGKNMINAKLSFKYSIEKIV